MGTYLDLASFAHGIQTEHLKIQTKMGTKIGNYLDLAGFANRIRIEHRKNQASKPRVKHLVHGLQKHAMSGTCVAIGIVLNNMDLHCKLTPACIPQSIRNNKNFEEGMKGACTPLAHFPSASPPISPHTLHWAHVNVEADNKQFDR